ncbi:MAG TPA: dihydrolipoyllysine-residue acetyltransferase [Pseudomonadales bacterium]
MATEIRIPDIGDVEHVEVVEICVAAGAEVAADDALIIIESDKASMEVPAGVAGVVASLAVAVGDTVAEGDLIAVIEAAGAAPVEDQAGEVAAEAPPQMQDPKVPPERAVASPPTKPEAGPSGTVEIRVPDIGEAEDVVVVEVAAAAGQQVGEDDLLVVVESDKASMEIPAGCSGTVLEMHVSEGAAVTEGTLIATVEVKGSSAAPAPAADRPEVEAGEVPRGAEAAAPQPISTTAAPPAGPDTAAAEQESAGTALGERIYAGPAVRRLARELGVDLARVRGTGARERIVKDDVKAYVKDAMTAAPGGAGAGAASGAGIPAIPQIDFSRFGPVEIRPLTRIRAAGAANLQRSWLNLPHVTQHDEADVTELEAFRASLKSEAERRGVKITPLAFIIKACCYALKKFPTFNASLDAEARNYVLKGYYNIGFAVDTEEGLVVPVIKGADQMGIWELSEAVTDLAGRAREQKLGMDDMQGGSFSVSSLGAIGGTGFTPIINAPEVGILGVSRLAMRPVWDGESFVPRKLLPLSLSYDHRAINGAEAGRFVSHLCELLADIRRLSL